jgi:TP901 family phage tail tape measure protein
MSEDMLTLGFDVDSRNVRKAKDDVQKFGEAGTKAGTSITKSTGKMQKSFNGVAVAAGAALSAMLSVGAAVRVIAEFETSMSRLGAVSGATGGELEALRDIAKDLGSTTEFSASQAADGLNFLAMAGFDAKEAMAAIPSVLDLATASGMGLAAAADTASNIMSGFGIAAADAAQVADVLAAASTRANTTVGQLGAAMSTVAPIASALDISLEDTAASIGVLSDAGIQGERAGTALRGVLASLAGPTTQAQKVLSSLGLTIADVDPATNNLSEVMAKLGAAGLSTADAMTLFGREAASGALVLIDGAQRVGAFGDELGRADGAAKAMATTMRDNLGGDLKGAASAAQGLAIALGDAGLTAIIRTLVQGVTGAVRAVTSAVEVFSEFSGVVINSLMVALAGLTATTIPAAVASLVTMTTGMTAAGIATGVFTGAVNLARFAIIALGGPIGIIFGILGSASAAWVLFGQKTDTATSAVEEGRIAIALLNESLDSFSQVESPAAQGAALGNAVAYKAQAQAALEVARAEMIKIQAMNQSAEQRLKEAGAEMPFGTEAGRKRASDAAAVVASMNEALVEADRRIKAVATTISAQQIPATVKATKVVTDLSNSLGGGKKSLDTSADNAAAALGKAEADAKALQDALDRPMISAIDGVSNAFGDLVVGGLKDFKGFSQSVLSTFASMLSQMIAMAVRNKIMIGLGIGGGGGVAGIANAATGGLGGGGGGIMSSIIGGFGSTGGGGLGALTGGTGLLGGAGSVISGLASGGLSGGIGAIGTALSGAGAGFAGAAAAIGAVAVPLLAVAAVFSFFKKKTKELGSGVRLTVDGMSASADKFSVIQTKRFWGLSKTITKSFSALDASVSGPLEKSLNGILSGIAGTALTLGVGADAFDRFSAQVEVSTKGLSASKANAAIKTALDDLANNFAGMINGLSALQKAGERAPDTLARIAASLSVVNDVFGDLGFTLYNASISGAGAAASFAELFGTVDNFVKSTASYYDAFFTADEKRDAATARLSSSLDALGIGAIPDDRAAFRDLVDQAQAAGNDGLTAALIMLSPSFADLTASVDQLSEVMRNQVQERNFATGVDLRRGLARASNGIEYTPKESSAEMLVELKALNARVDLLQSTSEFTAANTGATANNTEDQLTVMETTT